MSTITTAEEQKSEAKMGVASISANKRRLESPEPGEEEYVVAAKISKKSNDYEESVANDVQDTIIGHENSSSDFLTTSILARTLLTSTSGGSSGTTPISSGNYPLSCCTNSPSPLECLTSTLEALPAPSLLLDVTDEIRCSSFLPFKSTIQETTDLEFNGLLCHERLGMGTVTVLSPIDDDDDDEEWRRSKNCNQVITEDGKSYYNLGSADTLLVAKKSSTSTASTASSGGNSSPPQSLNDPVPNPDQWPGNCNNNADYIDDGGSSSSCESISSEDLFTSEEFDASEDEEEIRSYKQQRSTVLHLSLCKLNSFRTQQCVEPSLHRSVLICNTLRHIEQEIRSEDEIPMHRSGHQPLPPFWGRNSHNNRGNNNLNNNGLPLPPQPINQPQITDIRPPPVAPLQHPNVLHGHDPYLSPPYNNPNIPEPPYSCYDYNSLRPNPTPFHTASYDYEQDLPLVGGPGGSNNSNGNGISPGSSPPNSNSSLLDVSSSNCSLLEGDSGYGEDLNLSSYYYNTSDNSGSNRLGHGEPSSDSTYLSNCYNNSSTLVLTETNVQSQDSIMSDTSSLMSSASANPSDMSDIELHNSPLSRTNRDYLVGSCSNNSSSSDSSDSTSPLSETSISPPPGLGECHIVSCPNTSSNNGLSVSNDSNVSSLCWSKVSNPIVPQVTTCASTLCDNHMTTTTASMSINNNKELLQQSYVPSQESHQCGMESRLSEFNRSHTNFTNHHNLPMDSLISANYSNSL